MLLPLRAVIPAVHALPAHGIIYIPIHIVSGLPVRVNDLWVLPLIALLLCWPPGSRCWAAGQVYFRDL